MNDFYDEIIEEEISSTINFIDLKEKLKAELNELKIAINNNNKKKIKELFNNIDNFFNLY